MTTKNDLWRITIIGTAIGTVLAGSIFGVIGKLLAIMRAIAEGVSYAFGLIGTDIAVSMWLLAFGLCVVVISTKRRLVVISIKRRIVRAKEAEEERISATELINEIAQEAFQSKEPELDDVQIESVGAEEYDDDDWRSYTSDNILDIPWRWRWNGTTIESLTPICPECDMELDQHTSPMDQTGVMTGAAWLPDSSVWTPNAAGLLISSMTPDLRRPINCTITLGNTFGVMLVKWDCRSNKRRATDLSVPYCSLIKKGRRIPHQRHWQTLSEIRHTKGGGGLSLSPEVRALDPIHKTRLRSAR